MTPIGKNLTRVYDRTGVPHVRSLGSRDPGEWAEIRAFVRWLRTRRRWDVLDGLVAREFTPAEAFDAHNDGTLAGLVRAAERRRAEGEDVDLSPLVAAWGGRARRAKEGTRAKYVRAVRRLIPEGSPFPRSRFTRAAVARHLDARDVGPAMKNRDRIAFMQFTQWLVEREVLAANFVRDVRGQAEPKQGLHFLEPHQVRALADALPAPYRALEALMAGTGMEWGACRALTRRDVDVEHRMVFARGTKTEFRTRWVDVWSPPDDWAWAALLEHVKGLTPNAKVFPLRQHKALEAHHAASAALGLPRTLLRHHRHSFAVAAILARQDHQWIKNQLGHAIDSTVLYSRYALYIKQARMKAEAEAKRAAEPQATTTRKRERGDA